MRDLAVVVVAYHAPLELDTCLAALAAAAPVIVVDNSSDKDVKAVTEANSAIYVDAGANLGFAAGVNLGVKHVGLGKDVLLLNPDAVITPEALRTLHDHLRGPGQDDLAAVSPRLQATHAGTSQRVKWPLPTVAGMWAEAVGLGRMRSANNFFCIGAALLLRAEALVDIGAFDERFFLYAEETDWQRRARDRGWRVEAVTKANALHVGAGTSSDPTRREVLFHAGTETYVRKWYGSCGWGAYRLAAVVGACGRGLILPKQRGEQARARAWLFARGPRAVAGLPVGCPPAGRRVVHLVVTTNFAGVERYVCDVARSQAAAGSVVTVIGGDHSRMISEVGRAQHLPAGNVCTALAQLVRLGRQDVVHVHMTAAEVVALLGSWAHHATVISTRHFAALRGATVAARLLGKVVRRRLHVQVAISKFVADAVDESTRLIYNGVQDEPDDEGHDRRAIVLCLQRLETEKATDLALRAWALSNLAADGWELHLGGAGARRLDLERLSASLGTTDSVVFLGHVTDTRRRLREASLFLATAPAEPFGLSVAEAMAAATPVVASAGGAHPELLGEQAWTFPPGDTGAAALALRRAANSTEQCRRDHGRLLQQRQRTLFSLVQHCAALEDLYSAELR